MLKLQYNNKYIYKVSIYLIMTNDIVQTTVPYTNNDKILILHISTIHYDIYKQKNRINCNPLI